MVYNTNNISDNGLDILHIINDMTYLCLFLFKIWLIKQ